MSYWVFLADPKAYGWSDLVEDGSTVWDGIANRAAQNRLAQASPGDTVLFYHTAPDKALVGVARVVAGPYADPAHADRVVVELEPVTALARPLTLDEIRADPALADASFVRMPRVAVHGASEDQWERVLELTETDPGEAEGLDAPGAGGP
jgi:predicted RNA-binding protein with PUA-like domain